MISKNKRAEILAYLDKIEDADLSLSQILAVLRAVFGLTQQEAKDMLTVWRAALPERSM